VAENRSGQLPKDPIVAGKMLDHQAQTDKLRLERGVLGWFFGGKDNAPQYVAGFISVASFIAVCVLLFGNKYADVSEAVAVISGFLTLSLGFMFGRASKA
jgi:hypothetical protein